MKILLILSIFLIFPTLVLAQEINFLQDSYLPGETLQAEIMIPNLVSEITAKDIIITPKTGFFFKKLSNEYYFIYFNLPQDIKDGEYNIEIKDILYKEDNLLKETSISNKFKINSSIQRNLFTIQPAILEFESNTPYSKLIVENKESETMTLSISSTSELIKTPSKQIILPSNSQKSINIYTENLEEGTKEFLNVGHYKIPIWVLGGIPIVTKGTFSFSIFEDNKEVLLEELKAELNQNQIAYENIFIKNLLNESIYNLSISLTGNLKSIIKLETDFIEEFKPNQKLKEYLLINEERDPKFQTYSGSIFLKNEYYNIEFPILLNIIPEEVEEQEAPEKIKLSEEIEISEETEEKETKIEIKETSPLYFIITIIGIIILLIIVYIIIPKKKT